MTEIQAQVPRYSVGEEIANSITHGLGVVLSIAGLATLASFASVFGTVMHIVSCSIYGASLILMYTASTLYHSIPLPRAKAVLRRLDHSAIFLLIAGTYTPFTLVTLQGLWGWTLCALVWTLALVGILMQKVLIRQKAFVTALPYVALGWLAVVGLEPLMNRIPVEGMLLLVAGGLAYTIGVLFFVWKRVPYNHAIWHLFVMAGSALHYFAVLLFVIPVGL
jgi:hemolysin III